MTLFIDAAEAVVTFGLDLRTRAGREQQALRMVGVYPHGMRMWDAWEPPALGAAFARLVERGVLVNLTHEVEYPNVKYTRRDAGGGSNDVVL